jgi:hypothetical protein
VPLLRLWTRLQRCSRVVVLMHESHILIYLSMSGYRRRLDALDESRFASNYAEIIVHFNSGQKSEVSSLCFPLSCGSLMLGHSSLDNWQITLRKQYFKRDPEASPVGPEPSWMPSPAPEVSEEAKTYSHDDEADTPMVSTTHPTPVPEEIKEQRDEKTEGASAKAQTSQPAKDEVSPPTSIGLLADRSEASSLTQEEPKDWLDLPMLVKLDSLHLLTEWQFQNPQRLRTIMKNDDETALWVSFRYLPTCLSNRVYVRVYIFEQC